MSTVWNSLDDTGMTLTGSNLIATATSTNLNNGVRATTSNSSGLLAFAVSTDLTASGTGVGFSIASAVYDGSAAGSAQLFFSSPFWELRVAGSTPGIDNTSAAPTGSDVITIYLDLTNGLAYANANGNNLFGGDPLAQTGGISFATGSWFPCALCVFSGPPSFTLNPSPSSLPSGWSPWDGAAALVLLQQSLVMM